MDISAAIPANAIALAIAFVISLVAGLVFIPLLRRLKFGQTVREEGPVSHFVKRGTPTMGGIIFLVPVVLVSAIYLEDYPGVLPLVLVTIGFGFIGFVDDFIKVVRKHKDGLTPSQKMFGVLVISTAFTFYIAYYSGIGTGMIIPFTASKTVLELPVWFFIPFTIFVLISITNSVNMTDGLDGLAAGVTLIVMVFFSIVAMWRSEWSYIRVFSSIMAGGCLGFLAFNMYPAKVFMGDTGSLALGGAVGAVSVITGMPWILLIVGIVYVAESLSVILQVVSFKTTGKRIFKMAPIHHHFELCGWKETRVVALFWTITVVFCLLGFFTLQINLF